MFRRIALLLSIVVVLSMAVVVSAQDAFNGCYATTDAPLVGELGLEVPTVNEGVLTTVTFECANIPIINRVFGFQIGTSLPEIGAEGGDYVALPGVYAQGQFSEVGFGATNGVLEGDNRLSLYGLSRKLDQIVDEPSFTLGSYSLTAATNNTTVDGSIAVTFVDGTFKLSNDLGLPLTGWLRIDNDATIMVNDIDLAWLSGNTTVQSDSAAITLINNVSLNLGARAYTANNVATYMTVMSMDSAYLYVEDAAGVVGGTLALAQDSNNTLNIAVTADMFGHQACSTPVVNLGDAGSAVDIDNFVGTLGSITLKAGDVNKDGFISNSDATSIGDDFGDTDILINPDTENDINLDNTVNIFDLVHVGRNFDAPAGNCV